MNPPGLVQEEAANVTSASADSCTIHEISHGIKGFAVVTVVAIDSIERLLLPLIWSEPLASLDLSRWRPMNRQDAKKLK